MSTPYLNYENDPRNKIITSGNFENDTSTCMGAANANSHFIRNDFQKLCVGVVVFFIIVTTGAFVEHC